MNDTSMRVVMKKQHMWKENWNNVGTSATITSQSMYKLQYIVQLMTHKTSNLDIHIYNGVLLVNSPWPLWGGLHIQSKYSILLSILGSKSCFGPHSHLNENNVTLPGLYWVKMTSGLRSPVGLLLCWAAAGFLKFGSWFSWEPQIIRHWLARWNTLNYSPYQKVDNRRIQENVYLVGDLWSNVRCHRWACFQVMRGVLW